MPTSPDDSCRNPSNETVIAFPTAIVPAVFTKKPQVSTPGVIFPRPSTVASGILPDPVPQVGDSIGAAYAPLLTKTQSAIVNRM